MKSIKLPKLLTGHRYVIVGGSVYVFELLVIVVAQVLQAPPVAAVAISYILGTLLSFGLHKLYTFNDRRMQRRIVGLQLLATIGLVIWNFGFTLALTALLTPPLLAIVSRTLALAITTVWNFYLYRTRIFKQPPQG